MQHSVAKHVRDGHVCFVRAHEVQARVGALGRDAAAASYGVLSDCAGNRLVFVQQHVSRGATVTEHFRHDDGARAAPRGNEEEGEADEDDEAEATRRPGPRVSDERLRAMEVLRDRDWTVSQWCCQRRKRARLWQRGGSNACLCLDHRVPVPGWGYGTVRVPVAVFEGDGSLALAVHFSGGESTERHASVALAAHRLPHCRLDPCAVLLAASETSGVLALCNLEAGEAACAECLASDAEARRLERQRGRRGAKSVLDLTAYGQRACLVPGDALCSSSHRGRIRVGLVPQTNDASRVRVAGVLRDDLRIPAGWAVAVSVQRPDPYAVPVLVRWRPRRPSEPSPPNTA